MPAHSSGGTATREPGQATRRATSTPQGMTTRGTVKEQASKIQTAEDARTWLNENGALAETDDPIDVDVLKITLAMLYARKDVPQDVRDGMRAVAIGLEEVRAGETEKTVLESVGRAVEECREVLETLAETTVKTVKGMMEQTRELVERIEEGQVVEMRTTQRTIEEGRDAPKETTLPKMNYTQIARRAEHEDIVKRAKNRTRQVIVDNGEGCEGWKELSEKELVEKAKIAKDLMGVQGLDSPKVEFLSARKLKNGGVLYELNSSDAAEWLAKPDVRTSFLDKFGAGAKVKDRVFDVFVEFVPVSLGDNPSERLEMLEGRNGLHPGELVAAKWARAPRARHENQKVAHLVLSCATDRGANVVIRQGLIIEGKRVNARKLDMESRQCLKCQRYGRGHIANECKQETDTCGMCAKGHRTKDCTETNYKAFCCVNCKARGTRHDHPSMSRMCPVFVEAKNRLTERTPEMKYRFYPTDQQWTWVRTDDHRANAPNMPGLNTEMSLRGGTGQGRLAGGQSGQGGGTLPEKEAGGGTSDASEGGNQDKSGRKDPSGTQTTLDSFRWDSKPSSQDTERQSGSQKEHGSWNEKQFNEFMALLDTLAAQARQLSPHPSQ